MENRVKCWICGGWQVESLTRQVPFNGELETICLSCLAQIEEREDSLHIHELYEEDHRETED